MEDQALERALFRYQVISPLLAMDVPKGKKTMMYQELASKDWPMANGQLKKVSAETIRYWLRQYKKNGFEGLKDAERASRGTHIPEHIITKACQLKREVPERSIDKIITIMENMGFVSKGILFRSTLHRHLKSLGLSSRKLQIPDKKDLARWQADYANDIWQSDMLGGPYVNNPSQSGEKLKTYLYLFIDDASRMVLYGRFFFSGDLAKLELVFKRSIQRCGVPKIVYYDNARVYRSLHMKTICGELGIHEPIFTKVKRPEGHGKIEAWNRFCTSNFIAELKSSSFDTIDELNSLFNIWVEEEYNKKYHSEIDCSPRERWLRDSSRFKFVNEEKLRKVFLWRENRRVDKCAMIHLFGKPYRISPDFTGREVEVRYNPEHMGLIEIWVDKKFVERAAPFYPQRQRPPKAPVKDNSLLVSGEKTDYLGFLKDKYQETSPAINLSDKEPSLLNDEEQKKAFVKIFKGLLSPEIFEEKEIIDYWIKYGPFDNLLVEEALKNILNYCPSDFHISFYLNQMKGEMGL